MSDVKLEDIVSLAKRRGFVYPGSDIYGGLAGVYDYGPLGVALKRNIQNLWLKSFVEGWDGMYQVDSGLLMNKKVWEASGHATGFNDPLVECSNCHSRLRADHVEGNKCPVCGKEGTLGEPRQFNMMFKTHVGPVTDDESTTYLPPETAQSIFVNFKNILDSFSPDMPFGIAQIGKAFRNEISPREFLFRARDFELMEIEYFCHPDNWEKDFEEWRQGCQKFFKDLGLPESKIHELEVLENDRAHYSKRTIDFEFDFPFGRRELMGLAYRGDYDLSKHQEASGKNMEYRPKDGSAPFVPHVIEPSVGTGRLVLAVLAAAYSEDEQGGEKRIYLKFPPSLSPIQVAVLPLVKNNEKLTNFATSLYKKIKQETTLAVRYEAINTIGKRYRRYDEIGTPFCVTIDFESLDDNMVTVRNRDNLNQERIGINEVSSYLSDKALDNGNKTSLTSEQ